MQVLGDEQQRLELAAAVEQFGALAQHAFLAGAGQLAVQRRALGVGLPYAITVSIFGGTAPAVALYFKSIGHEDWFYYYLSGMIFLSLLIYSTMRDTKHESAMHRHE